MVKFMSLQYTYCTGYSTNRRGELKSNSFLFSFFLLVVDLEDKALVKLKSPCFGVAWLIRCNTLGRKGQKLLWKGGEEPGTLADRER